MEVDQTCMDSSSIRLANAYLQKCGIILLNGLNASFHPMTSFEAPCIVQGKIRPKNQISVGAYTGIYGGEIGWANIGRFCSIASQVDIASDQHPVDWLSTSMIQYVNNIHSWREYIEASGEHFKAALGGVSTNARVLIGNDVWIGRGALVKSGVHIGDGVIVGGGSVVVKDVPAYHIVAGNPAKTIRLRFSDAIVEKLLQLEWWKYNIFSIEGLDFKKIESALELIEQGIADGTLGPLPVTMMTVSGALDAVSH